MWQSQESPATAADTMEADATMTDADGTDMDSVVMDDDIDLDSGYSSSSSIRQASGSLSSSIREYRTIWGRTFQNSNTTDYWAPNDEEHLEGMDITHAYTLLLMNGALFWAPIDTNRPNLKILDIGTGTGIWAIDVADMLPAAEVFGTDISAVQPEFVPPNCTFEIDDVQLDWLWGPDHFDVIHARCLYGGIDDWQHMYDQAFTHLKPGGWFESMEFDIEAYSLIDPAITENPDHVFKRWAKLFWEAGDVTGRTFRVAQKPATPDGEIMMVRCMREAGFVDIVHKKWTVPIGSWASGKKFKEIGGLAYMFMDQSLHGWTLKPLGEILHWEPGRIEELVAEMRAALERPATAAYFE
ncbi:methyltransferase domain-containing protein [Colletotrichum kahawae]|uniref:Methyltransferase domain-containing protein n=1 Tax=Colletotrichum kahawae TaxID=34407 RepID=A0AAD9Y688_COLKA|nr:methyltransferase domain-containing protein [Colletotrichum kahawae]